VGVQEVSWDKSGFEPADCAFFCESGSTNDLLGIGFYMHE